MREAFQRSKAAYPRREGANPWQPAQKKFETLVKSGVDPAEIIAAAEKLAQDEAARGNIGTRFIPQAVTWLKEHRFADVAQQHGPPVEPQGYYAKFGSEQLDAWDKHHRLMHGKGLPRDRNGGWRVPTEWPPQKPDQGEDAA